MTEVLRNMKSQFAVALLTAMATLTAHAAVPAALNYQGFLTNPTTGAPITTSAGVPLTVTFNLWDALTAGNLIYTETQPVTVTNGVFSVQIGSVTPLLLPFNVPYWLEVTVGTGGTAQTLTPRQPLASSATALRAAVAESLVAAPGTGANDTALGNGALHSNTTGFQNTASGVNALYSNTTGNNNTASGLEALYANTTGSSNTAAGRQALVSNTIGSANTAFGEYSLRGNTTANENVAVGAGALQFQSYNNGGVAWNSLNTAVGYTALLSNQPTSTGNGINNTALGGNALFSNTSGYYNTAGGTSALYSNTLGAYNTASGTSALYSNTTGSINTASGVQALFSNTTGNSNTASGTSALFSNTTGSGNTALGLSAGLNQTTGSNNIYIGNSGVAGESNNVYLGNSSHLTTTLYGNVSTSGSIAGGTTLTIGSDITAGGGVTAGGNLIAHGAITGDTTLTIGGAVLAGGAITAGGSMTAGLNLNVSSPGAANFGATTRQMLNLYGTAYGIGVQDYAMYFRTGSDFEWYMGGAHSAVRGGGNPANGAWLMGLSTSGLAVNGTFVSLSDRNAKENFATIDPAAVLEKVARLPLQSWNYRNDENKVKHLGPMAQDFHAAFNVGPDDKHIATVDESGVALAAIQGLNAKFETALREKAAQLQSQAEKISALESDRKIQTAQIAELQRTIELLVAHTRQVGPLALMH